MDKNCRTLLFGILIIVAILHGVKSQLPCDSHLRAVFPQYFQHCSSCTYSEWTDWNLVPNSVVTSTSCSGSGEAYSEIRTRSASGDCDDETETRYICLPPRKERLVLALGLGSTAGDSNGIIIADRYVPASAVNETGRLRRQAFCPVVYDESGRICHRFVEPRGKRGSTNDNTEQQKRQAIDALHSPLPFNWNDHGHRFRRQTGCYKDTNNPKYVLFLLDTSGSIGTYNFQKLKTAVHDLIPLFCSPIHTAVMTFNHEFNLEFCFNCFGNSYSEQLRAQAAVNGIDYRDGWTHTGGAARCACHDVLDEECGLPDNAACIDVIFITDGLSNDPSLEICDEVNCLKNRPGVTTHAIGIGLGDRTEELNCIKDATNAFKFRTVDDFLDEIDRIRNEIGFGAGNGIYSCANQDVTISG